MIEINKAANYISDTIHEALIKNAGGMSNGHSTSLDVDFLDNQESGCTEVYINKAMTQGIYYKDDRMSRIKYLEYLLDGDFEETIRTACEYAVKNYLDGHMCKINIKSASDSSRPHISIILFDKRRKVSP